MRRLIPIGLAAALSIVVSGAVAPNAGAADLSALIAPPGACAGQTDLDAPIGVQREAMLCMTNYARRHSGEGGVSDARKLDRSAQRKSVDILRCDSFSHFACGRGFTYWIKRSGYLSGRRCWRTGENIAWGTGRLGSVRSIFSSWIHSPGHRENILGRYSQMGIGVRLGNLDGYNNAHVWTQHFGDHC